MKKNMFLGGLMVILFTMTLCGCQAEPEPSSVESSVTESTAATIPPPKRHGQVTVELTGFNDFHASITEKEGEPGLAKFATALKKRKREGSILVNSGDMWKGEYLDAYDRGALVSRSFREIGVDVTTIGNHEFDWGPKYITRNEGPDYLNDKMLGANIFKYPKGSNGWEKADIGAPYKIITQNEGKDKEVRIGFIGVIGPRQLTSIDSLQMKDYMFLPTEEIIKKHSRYLRQQMYCDLVIASYHDGSFDGGITQIDPETNMPYVNGIFLGHTHKRIKKASNGIPALQAAAHGSHLAEMAFTLDFDKKSVEVKNYDVVKLDPKTLVPDEEIADLIQKAETDPDYLAMGVDEVIGTAKTSMGRDDMARYFATVSAKKVAEVHPEIDICIFNDARESLPKGDFTFSDLFYTNPFENDLYIIDVDFNDISSQASASYFYRVREEAFTDTSRYKALVYSYNGLHIQINGNQEKEYDRFESLNDETAKGPVKVEDLPDLEMNAVMIAVHEMKAVKAAGELYVLDRADYSRSLPRYDSSRLLYPLSA